MQSTRNKRATRLCVALLAAALIGSDVGLPIAGLSAQAASSGTASATSSTAAAKSAGSSSATFSDFVTDTLEPYFMETMAEWEKKGYKPAVSGTYLIPGTQISDQSADRLAVSGNYKGAPGQVLLWKSDRENWIEYKINIQQEGLYQFNLNYHPYNKDDSKSVNRRPITLAVTVDGQYPFREARAIPFRRQFYDELPLKQDKNGDDIRPRPLAIEVWSNEPFRDSLNASSSPLQWYLSKGTHTIRLTGNEAIAIASLTIAPPEKVSPYAEVVSKIPAGTPQTKDIVRLQAENMTAKNDVAIQIAVDKDPLTTPRSLDIEKFNSVGGARWATGGQKISWKFTVPENGRYKIAMRALQNTVTNMSTYRRIEIDGKVPFKELEAYRFPYSSRWLGVTLQNDDGKPYEVYLEKGEHVLSMSATIEPFQPAIVKSEHITTMLRGISMELRAMAGSIPDKNRTWDIAKDFPDLPVRLGAVRNEMKALADLLLHANGRRDNMYQIVDTSIKDIDTYLRYPNEIPYYSVEISSIQEKMGTIRETLIRAGLQLDEIYIVPSGADMPKMEASFFQKLWGSTQRFFYSFFQRDDLSNLDQNALNVWVNRPRDYVNLLQELADQMFTPETGIPVKITLLPDENLLIYANAAGISPDVVLGQPQDKSVDFAMRNALQDLSQFPDFKEVASTFAPGALLPFFYNKGYYALPETQSFKVLFYRKDILKQLGLGLPNTWEDVYDMLPTLQQNGYNFYVPPTDFITFLYQNGAEFFTKDGMKTALNTPEALKGFKQWTDLFNIYDLERSVPNFYQHFRKGNIPIGIADYNTYIQLTVAAPELTGWWGIAPLPGVRQSNGTVVRWSSGGQSTGFIYKSSKKKDDAWKFLKWIVSAEVQERYGSDLEAFYGVAFRWNTANVEAFSRLPWPKNDLNVILEQWRWYKEMPNLPGSYFVPRELNNAWNRTVISNIQLETSTNYRESLEEAIVNIDREMVRKEQEFGFVSPEGKVLQTLDWPVVNKPWEGVAPYVAK